MFLEDPQVKFKSDVYNIPKKKKQRNLLTFPAQL